MNALSPSPERDVRPKPGHKHWIDWLRAVAAFAVVIIHVTAPLYAQIATLHRTDWWIANVVNCAGVGWAGRILSKNGPHDLELFRTVITVNLLGTFNVMRLAANAMQYLPTVDDSGQRGVIINTASVAAFEGQIGQIAYTASKGGVHAMTITAARDLAQVGIRVNTIAPGLIDTPIYGEGEAAEAFKAKLGESVLFPHRLGAPDELASMVVELVTNSYMNAEVIRVDGGIRMPPK